MIHVQFEDQELPELRKVLDRAMNTWEPRDQPKWLQELSDRVDQRLSSEPVPRLYADD